MTTLDRWLLLPRIIAAAAILAFWLAGLFNLVAYLTGWGWTL